MNSHSLTKDEINRFSRQLILPEIGVKGQEKLENAKVLIVGGGGLGCPLSIYLGAAGVGQIGILDYDCVEKNNLHRQILHTEAGVGTPKVDSICSAIKELNSDVNVLTFRTQISQANALEIVSKFDIVADCTDNVATRYLLNDSCVLCKKPLVSGSALRWEGQLTVYNAGHDCPCYRCIFPTPPPPETVTNCSEGGVVGAVPGIIGTMQALEIIKMASGLPTSYAQRLFLFDGLSGQTRAINLRPRSPNCSVCGDAPTVTELIDYEEFCGTGACDKIRVVKLLPESERISVQEYQDLVKSGTTHVLIDTRPEIEFEICKLHNALNIPFTSIVNEDPATLAQKINAESVEDGPISDIFVVCRRGNDSQEAVVILKEKLSPLLSGSDIVIKDLIGGLESWATIIDPDFPTY